MSSAVVRRSTQAHSLSSSPCNLLRSIIVVDDMPATVPRRRTPEELLQQAQAEETYERRGKLKVFLGYASGVGKSFRMLDEGRRRSERGQDIVVGAIQPKTAPDIEGLMSKLEAIPLKSVDGVPVMDLPAILARHPGVCLVDGL